MATPMVVVSDGDCDGNADSDGRGRNNDDGDGDCSVHGDRRSRWMFGTDLLHSALLFWWRCFK